MKNEVEIKCDVKAGDSAVIDGATYAIRDQLRAAGYSYLPTRRAWGKTYMTSRTVTYMVHPRCRLRVAGRIVYDDTVGARNARHEAARYGTRRIPGSAPDDTF